MAVPGAEDVYLTLLLNDTYLPGALVLAHSLRDAGTTKKLGVLVTLDSVAAEAITHLKAVYDFVIPVPRIRNAYPANLSLMNRADLHSAFTKINLWRQTNFRKVVYIDADVVAYRAPDELFDIPHAFSAAPDIGWPDLFNSGVMVLEPNMGDYYALTAMAERGISFDGADQGLLNMHFKNTFNRLSFTYNVTPSAHYQYVPAYRHFQSSISMVHFIGSDKPWFQGRYASTGSGPFDEMIGRWWAVYDRHYRAHSPEDTASRSSSELVQYLTKGEYHPRQPQAERVESTGERDIEHGEDRSQPHVEAQPGPTIRWHEQSAQAPFASSFTSSIEEPEAEARKEQIHQPHEKQEQRPITFSNWDAQKHPPPSDSKPEAANFPATIYEMSRDTAPFVAPERYPSPPKGMWYEVPKDPPAPSKVKPKSIFPWETHKPRASRVFVGDSFDHNESEAGASSTPTGEPSGAAPSDSLSPTKLPLVEKSTGSAEHGREPATPVTPTISVTPSDPWTTFTRTNAWDDIPEIERYVDKLHQKHGRSKSLKSPGTIGMPDPAASEDLSEWQRRGSASKVTDFPSETERPSLPVTPAPIRRPKFWGGGGPGIGDDDEDDPLLPTAQGVPGQSEWDPAAQLQKLAKQQSEVLLQKLGGQNRDSSELPPRAMPFGSDELTSPTYVAQPTKVLSPQPMKTGASSSILSHHDESTSQGSAPAAVPATSGPFEQASYQGPGATFEKGEDVPQHGTPLPPTEKEQDVLES